MKYLYLNKWYRLAIFEQKDKKIIKAINLDNL